MSGDQEREQGDMDGESTKDGHANLAVNAGEGYEPPPSSGLAVPPPTGCAGQEPSRKGPRRSRYGGTHPRQYAERYKELAPDAYPGMQAHIRSQGRTPAGTHVPVMLREVLEHLDPRPGETVADCTIGYGGHAEAFLERIGPTGRLVGLDVDGEQLERTRLRLENVEWRIANSEAGDADSESTVRPSESVRPSGWSVHRFPLSIHRSHFAGLGKIMQSLGLQGFDVIFADLGVSSMQLDDPGRGFSYKHDGPLDMRMGVHLQKTAADLLASMSEDELGGALRDLADEPDHAAIARAFVRQRQLEPITSTGQLVALIFGVKGISRRAWKQRAGGRAEHSEDPRTRAAGFSPRGAPVSIAPLGASARNAPQSPSVGATRPDSSALNTPPGQAPSSMRLPAVAKPDADLHPAARTFQALRILVNDELHGLEQFLRIAPYCLLPGGRIGVISFHSGEDRIVKRAFRDGFRTGAYEAVSDSVIRPSAMEAAANPRAKSAKLRWACKDGNSAAGEGV